MTDYEKDESVKITVEKLRGVVCAGSLRSFQNHFGLELW